MKQFSIFQSILTGILCIIVYLGCTSILEYFMGEIKACTCAFIFLMVFLSTQFVSMINSKPQK